MNTQASVGNPFTRLVCSIQGSDLPFIPCMITQAKLGIIFSIQGYSMANTKKKSTINEDRIEGDKIILFDRHQSGPQILKKVE